MTWDFNENLTRPSYLSTDSGLFAGNTNRLQIDLDGYNCNNVANITRSPVIVLPTKKRGYRLVMLKLISFIQIINIYEKENVFIF